MIKLLSIVACYNPKQYTSITATYTRGRLIEDPRRALATWAWFLEITVRGMGDDKVIPLLGSQS